MTLNRNTKGIPHIDDGICRICRQCIARSVCPTKAIRVIDRDEPPFIDSHRCMGCHDCVTACPSGAIIRPVAEVQA